MRIVLLIFTCIFLLNGCAEPKYDSICRENGNLRTCTKQEQAVIDGMHTIIRGINNYSIRSGSFFVGKKNAKNPRVIFFGEKHTEAIGQIETLGYINQIAGKDELVLLEGADRRRSLVKDACALGLVERVFYAWEWVKLGKPYASDFMKILNKKYDYDKLLEITKESYDLTGLNLTNLTCGYWDDEDALDADVTYRSLKVRNKAMVQAINYWATRKPRVLIIAGAGHLPTGEKLYTHQENSRTYPNFPEDLPSYYQLIKSQRKMPEDLRSLRLERRAGATKPIYDYLAQTRLPYAEYIHGSMIY